MTIAEVILLEEKNGFRKYGTCMDYIFSASHIEKHREYNIPTYIAFIGLEKAFNTVNRAKLWEILQNKGIPRNLIRTVQNMYMNTVIITSKEFKTRDDFEEISQGVRQGWPMSPTLHNLYFDKVIRKWHSQLKTNCLIADIPLNALLFTDDQIVLADSE
jgi:hypothetical protein